MLGRKMREPIRMGTIYLGGDQRADGNLEFKYLIILVLVLIVGSLAKALFHLSSNKPGDSAKMVKALTWRIGLSVGLFVLLIIAYYQGWVTPGR